MGDHAMADAGPQHLKALERANRVRLARAALKRQVAAGERGAAERARRRPLDLRKERRKRENERLQKAAPEVFEMLSALGRRLYFPKGILTQGAEAKQKAEAEAKPKADAEATKDEA